MEGWGLVLNGIGAMLIAYSQFQINRVLSMWLPSLDLTVQQLTVPGADVLRINGIDEHWQNALRWDRWYSGVGWVLFVVGFWMLMWSVAAKAH